MDLYIKLGTVSKFHLFLINCKNFSETISITPTIKLFKWFLLVLMLKTNVNDLVEDCPKLS